MDVGRNDPCPCGSGKKYKKCCIGKEPAPARKGITGYTIEINSFTGEVRGLDERPDLKRFFQDVMRESNEEEIDVEKAANKAIERYTKRIVEVTAKLGRPLGNAIKEAEALLGEGQFEEGLSAIDKLLEAYPESIEIKGLRDGGLLALGKHPSQEYFAKIHAVPKNEREIFLKGFREAVLESAPKTEVKILSMLCDAYYQGTSWEERYMAVRMANHIILDMAVDKSNLEKADSFLLDALRDEDGRVRNAAVNCVQARKIHNTSGLFFDFYEIAIHEQKDEKRRSLCRAILSLVCPMLDWEMESIGEMRDYRKAIDFALKITGYNPAYYRADPEKKIWMSFGRNDPRKRKYQKNK